jgi:hypothetical protein
MKQLLLRPRFRISSPHTNGRLVAFGIGPQESFHVVLALREVDDRFKQPGEASFFKTQAEKSKAYLIRTWAGTSEPIDTFVASESFNVTKVQPLGDDLLLVFARCFRKSETDIEKNARLFGRDGVLKTEMVLGDGIEHLQVAPDQTIWVAYFDEGIFGNFGWEQPLGASGLVQWSQNGNRLYEYSPTAGLGPIYDCYAMNVDFGGDVWCCYYMDFPLVRLRGGEIREAWQSPVTGASSFAIDPPFALFYGSFDGEHEFTLVELSTQGAAKVVGGFIACDEDGQPLKVDRAESRGPAIHLVSGDFVYTVGIDACLWAG